MSSAELVLPAALALAAAAVPVVDDAGEPVPVALGDAGEAPAPADGTVVAPSVAGAVAGAMLVVRTGVSIACSSVSIAKGRPAGGLCCRNGTALRPRRIMAPDQPKIGLSPDYG